MTRCEVPMAGNEAEEEMGALRQLSEVDEASVSERQIRFGHSGCTACGASVSEGTFDRRRAQCDIKASIAYCMTDPDKPCHIGVLLHRTCFLLVRPAQAAAATAAAEEDDELLAPAAASVSDLYRYSAMTATSSSQVGRPLKTRASLGVSLPGLPVTMAQGRISIEPRVVRDQDLCLKVARSRPSSPPGPEGR